MNKKFCKLLKAKGHKQRDILHFVNNNASVAKGRVLHSSRLSAVLNGLLPPTEWELEVIGKFCKKHGLEFN